MNLIEENQLVKEKIAKYEKILGSLDSYFDTDNDNWENTIDISLIDKELLFELIKSRSDIDKFLIMKAKGINPDEMISHFVKIPWKRVIRENLSEELIRKHFDDFDSIEKKESFFYRDLSFQFCKDYLSFIDKDLIRRNYKIDLDVKSRVIKLLDKCRDLL